MSSSQALLKSISPWTGRVLAERTMCDVGTLPTRVAQARTVVERVRAQSSLKERATALERAGCLLRERRDQLSALLADEVGKPITQARSEVDG